MKKTFLSLTIFLLIWASAALLLDRPFLPGPVASFRALAHQAARGALASHLMVSFLRITAAQAAAFIPAFLLGMTAGLSLPVDKALTPMMYLLFPVPKVALLPVILLFLGLGNLSKIFLVALILFFQFYLSIRDETRHLDRRYFDSLYSLGGSKADLLKHVIIPALLPRIFSTFRLTLGTSTAVLFLAETFATREGLGYYIMESWSRLEYDQMYAGILTLSLMGFFLFLLVEGLERKFCPWSRIKTGRS
jgi:NitT/TauT family transport system permease protein